MEKEQKQESNNDTHNDRMPLSKCKELLKAEKNGLTDEQVLRIRNFLYELAQLDYRITMRAFQLEDLESEQTDNENVLKESNENKQTDQEPPQHDHQIKEQTKTIPLTPKQYRKAS